MKEFFKSKAALWLKLAIAIALFYWLFSSNRLDLSSLSLVVDRWQWLLFAQFSFVLVNLIHGVRWQLLLRAQGIRYSAISLFNLVLVGTFFNQIAFGSTGGDVYRAYAVARGFPGNASGAVASVLVDRVFGLLALLVLVIAAGVVGLDLLRGHTELVFFVITAAAITASVFVLVLLYFSERVRRLVTRNRLVSRLPFRHLLSQLHLAVDAYRHHGRTLWQAALLSLVMQVLLVVTNIFLARALLDDFDLLPFFLLVPAAHLTMAIPINPPGALGTAEAVYAYLFELVNIGVGGLIAILQRLTVLAWSLAGAAIFVLHKDWPALNENPERRVPPSASSPEARSPP